MEINRRKLASSIATNVNLHKVNRASAIISHQSMFTNLETYGRLVFSGQLQKILGRWFSSLPSSMELFTLAYLAEIGHLLADARRASHPLWPAGTISSLSARATPARASLPASLERGVVSHGLMAISASTRCVAVSTWRSTSVRKMIWATTRSFYQLPLVGQHRPRAHCGHGRPCSASR
jgi:hypothetical protein